MKYRIKNYHLLLITLSIIIIVDRLLLWQLGLPLWEWDGRLHYKHRPNIVRYWARDENKPIIINEYGQHDDSFPIEKGKKELRILNLGDSITMGHGLTKDETYSKYLETILSDSLRDYDIIQAINAGVQGYSTFQELEILKRDLIFKPDIVTIGFCLNDVTEPFIVNRSFGGTGLDYHQVTQAPNKFVSYLLNETGFGRLIQELRIRKLDAKQEKLAEMYDVKRMLLQKDDSTYQQQWKFTLKILTEIYTLCKNNNIPVILLIFPYTFQFSNTNLYWSQELLIKNANDNDIPCIDFLDVFQNLIEANPALLREYFLDENHFTSIGHQVVAKELSKIILHLNVFNQLLMIQ